MKNMSPRQCGSSLSVILAYASMVSCSRGIDRTEQESLTSADLNFTADINVEDAKASAPQNYHLPTGTLDNAALANCAKLKRDQVRKDAFSKGFDDSAIAGRKFRVIIPLSERTDETAAVWRYDADKQELLLELDMDYSADLEGQMATFQRAQNDYPSQPMTNAFGVVVDVKRTENWLIGVGTVGRYAGIIPRDEFTGGYSYLTTTLKMVGPEARNAVSGMTLEIQGTVQKNKLGQTVHCSERTTEPKVDSPIEITAKTCVVQSSFSRISFITSNGEVLKEWRR